MSYCNNKYTIFQISIVCKIIAKISNFRPLIVLLYSPWTPIFILLCTWIKEQVHNIWYKSTCIVFLYPRTTLSCTHVVPCKPNCSIWFMRGIIMRPRKFNMHDLSQLFPIPLLYGPVIVSKTVITKHLFYYFGRVKLKVFYVIYFNHFSISNRF